MADDFKVIKALSYEGKRVAPGEVVADIPASSVEWLIEAGAIALVIFESPPKAPKALDAVVVLEVDEAVKAAEAVEVAVVEFPNHLGGGFYELSDGSKPDVRGKDAAIAAQAALDAADEDA